MMIHTGLRTDIPAFYADWFAGRLRAGSVCVRRPYAPNVVTRYRLTPDVVDLIAFCTKNPAPMFPHLELLAPFGQYWFVTITPYGKEIEPNVPSKKSVLESFKYLSDRVGADSVAWRYDPVFISAEYPVERHLDVFAQMASELAGYTRTCVISFIDLYEKVKRNFPEVRAVSPEDRIRIGSGFARIGRGAGMTVKACAEGNDLAPYGIDCSGCMTVRTYETALHCTLNVPGKKPARRECACLLCDDIGGYNTCAHLCRYCYANISPEKVRRNRLLHDPRSPFLIGGGMPGDIVRDADQVSWIDPQPSLF